MTAMGEAAWASDMCPSEEWKEDARDIAGK